MAITYGQYIQTFLKVDEDSKGLYVEVPGYASDSFKVYCDESGTVPMVTHCRCSKFAHKGTCDHAEATQAFWNKIYKTNIQKAEVASIEASIDASDEQEEAYEMAAIAEQVQAPKVVKIKKVSEIVAPKLDHHSKLVLSFFSGLPSRQKTAA